MELVFFLLLAGLIICTGVFSLRGIVQEVSVKKTAYDAINLLEQAAVIAVRSGTNVEILVSGQSLSESYRHRQIEIPPNQKITMKFGTANSLVFYPSGSSSAGKLIIEEGASRCEIIQTINGSRRAVCGESNT